MSTVLSDLVAKLKWLFPLVDGCHCGYMTKIEEKKSLQRTATKQCHSTLVKSFLHCQAPPPPVLSSSAHKKKTNFLIDSVLNLIVCDREHGHATCLHIKG
jgi:hypothetical protein